jgi:lipopolysaccharide biosynthesis glycosyltransferase
MFKNKFILLNNYKNDITQFSHYELKNNQNIINENILKILFTLLLIFNAYFYCQYYLPFIETEENDSKNHLKLNDYGRIMSNHSLYELYKYEQISVLIYGIDNWKINDKSILKLIDSLKEQTLKEIETIFIFPNHLKNSKVNLIKKNIHKDKKMQIFFTTENEEFDAYYLMNLIKGKFIFILDKFITFDENELKKFFDFTNGKIDNIFETKIQNDSFYLIKTKILRNLIDNGQIFNNYPILINNLVSFPKPQLNYISIAMCPNDYYVPLTYVSMISILSSKGEFTFISFYLIISKEFNKKNIDFLLSLYEQFDYFNISFVEMDDRYKNAFISKRMTIQTYFRFSLGELFPHLNRMLYLDSDIIVYKDLNTLYNLNFNGKMVLGQVTGCNRSKKTGIYHINNGILLFNLMQMRKMKIEEKVFDIIKKGEKLRYHDQTLMNNYFKKHIGIFPIEYHIRNWANIREVRRWNKISGNVYDNDYIYFAQKYPSIRHFLGPYKPMHSEVNHIEDWWFFARKSKYYQQKSNKFKNIFSFK